MCIYASSFDVIVFRDSFFVIIFIMWAVFNVLKCTSLHYVSHCHLMLNNALLTFFTSDLLCRVGFFKKVFSEVKKNVYLSNLSRREPVLGYLLVHDDFFSPSGLIHILFVITLILQKLYFGENFSTGRLSVNNFKNNDYFKYVTDCGCLFYCL